MTKNVDFLEYLRHLYREQLSRVESPYLRAHSSTRGALLRQIRATQIYLPYLPTGRVLDWGCSHAPDACMIRLHHGNDVELHGCDIHPPDSSWFSVFHQAADLEYRQVDHPYRIPYENDYFDAIVADGVIEHVPNDSESLKELYRILKPDGLLIISCLPNRYSYLEWIARRCKLPHHFRTYTAGQMRAAMLHSGFQPFLSRHLQMLPTLSGLGMVNDSRWLNCVASFLWGANSIAEKIWPLNRLASNIFILAKKRRVIAWDRSYLVHARPLSEAA